MKTSTSDRRVVMERLQAMADAKTGDPLPEFMTGPEGWGKPLSEIARETLALIAGDDWCPMDTAPRDGTAFLAYGRHTYRPPDAQRGVEIGDHWWGIILWDIWRSPRWVFSKDGAPAWSEPTAWQPLTVPKAAAASNPAPGTSPHP